MNTMFFNAVSCFFVCAGLIIALILAINVIFHRQSMKIMNIVWVLTGLWGHYFALFAYYTFGVRKDNMVATAIQLYIPTCQANNEKKSALKARETASRKEIASISRIAIN